MAPLASFLAVAGLASLVAAVPSPKVGITVGTTVHQVRNPDYVSNGPLALYKTYLKYGVNPPENLRKYVERSGFLTKRSEATVKSTPTNNVDDAYTIPVSIGTPPQVMQLNLDTGSADLWVFSTETESDDVGGQKLYNPSSSSTSKKMAGYTWTISYGDGSSADGDIYTDKVTIGGITVSKQAVELAQDVSSSFTLQNTSDGILGMGFDSINMASPSTVQTFFGNAQSKLNSPLFTADLKFHAVGSYGFGFINSSLHTGSIVYEDVDNSNGWWSWTSSGYAIGSGSFVSTNVTGIADTGTTLLLLPVDIVEAYYNKVSGSSYSNTYDGFTFPCSSTVPPFTFGVGKLRFKIPANYLNYGAVETGSSTCFGGIQLNLAVGTSIFGDVALKSAFVVFNGASKPTIGWANKKL
ncbi:hypothetical protein SEPCBS57363_001702 [Sporothrix epigloea]|uniref:Peptidase A1 domain-containing protein n=1 Tax=Sporothrix epigloea TaxID=1892477 RepID=A0ABP0DBS9_9PEZI